VSKKIIALFSYILEVENIEKRGEDHFGSSREKTRFGCAW